MIGHPGAYSLTVYRGDSYTWVFRVWGDEAHTEAIDLAGVEADAVIRAGGTHHVLDVSIVLPNSIHVALGASVSRGLAGSGKWDLQFTYPGDIVYTLVAGSVSVAQDVTA
jgi:hypothetical protein